MGEIAKITYAQTKQSVLVDELGMRQMQRRVYEKRASQYLLLKAPPASGKSRAFMFIAIDKLYRQGLKKVIIAVPEMSIGGSFKKTNLMSNGFFANWEPNDQYNLCTPGSDSNKGKVDAFVRFLKEEKKDRILICTHATLRFAYDKLKDSDFNDVFLGVDEFHHASANTDENRLGELVKGITENSTAHVMAMTGSYFRGDGIAVLDPEVENRFDTITYSYYDQLSGYKYLHAITLSYEFYSGVYYDSLAKSLNLDRKTIIHIPNVNSQESSGNKYEEVNHIIDIIGTIDHEDKDGVLHVKSADGRMIKVIDLVDDRDPDARVTKQKYLKEHSEEKDAVDIIIALNMAREGFDWPPCEQMLTIGYRGSLTEIIQIIGRATRDYEGKSEAFFTNIIVEPDATRGEVITSVNNLLKAITASLLMEQVLAPKWDFKAKAPKLQILQPESEKGKEIIQDSDIYDDLLDAIRTDVDVIKANLNKDNSAQMINKYLIPQIIMEKYPDLSTDDVEAIRQHVVTDLVLGSGTPTTDDGQDIPSGGNGGGSTRIEETADPKNIKFIKFANGMALDIKELDINLIDKVNPFAKAYQILSKEIDKPTLRAIKDAIDKKKGRMKQFSEKECYFYWPNIVTFVKANGRNPDRLSEDEYEALLGAVLYTIKQKKEARENEG